MIKAFICLYVILTMPNILSKPLDFSPTHFSEAIFLLVDKSTFTAQLRTLPQDPLDSKLLKTYPIAIGKKKGDKQQEGDLKTPEGIYFSLSHLTKESLLQSKYGDLAIPTDYPNLYDRYLDKTGYGIWIHGAGDDKRMLKKHVTEGCVIFYNNTVLKLKKWLIPNQSLVVITNDIKTINQEHDIKGIKEQLLHWFEDFKQQTSEHASELYHVDYVSNKDADTRSLSPRNSSFPITITNTRVLSHQHYGMTFLNLTQKNKTTRHVLYWLKTNHLWQLLGHQVSAIPLRYETFHDLDLKKL